MHALRLLGFLVIVGVALAAPGQERAIEFPDVPGFRTLVVDLHTHSVFSDGTVWPTIRIDESERDGLDLMAVTEHLEYQPHRDDIPHPDRNRSFELATGHAARAAPDLIVVNGAEVTRDMPPGHVNAVFVRDANALLTDDAVGAFLEANRQGAFVFWNHPSWTGQRDDGVAVMTELHRWLIDEGLLHGLEVANGQIYSAEALQMALDHELTILGVSDVHGLIDWDYAVHDGGHRTATLVFAPERSAESVREALHARRTVAWMGNTLIGREDVLLPLIEASLQVVGVAKRDASDLIDVTIANRSDATFQLRNRGDHNLYDQPSLIEIPAHGETNVAVAGEARTRFDLVFEVLNAITAPDTSPRLRLRVVLP